MIEVSAQEIKEFHTEEHRGRTEGVNCDLCEPSVFSVRNQVKRYGALAMMPPMLCCRSTLLKFATSAVMIC
jgi:hypothetical protein